jgi:hypothetical protein
MEGVHDNSQITMIKNVERSLKKFSHIFSQQKNVRKQLKFGVQLLTCLMCKLLVLHATKNDQSVCVCLSSDCLVVGRQTGVQVLSRFKQASVLAHFLP